MKICPVIIAGGNGTRLWPLSREARPKQFLSLHGHDSMLQSTAKRLENLDIQPSITVCNEEHRFFVAEQLRNIDMLGRIILEPEGKNTAPAIALAALSVSDDPILLILPADHVIKDNSAFVAAVNKAIPLAEAGKLITFGISAKEPHTGYGYIKRGSERGAGFDVDEFVEKPSFDIAQGYVESGDFYWNSGMFLFKASRYLQELKKFRPDIFQACSASMENNTTDFDFLRVDKEIFDLCPSESIDYAVMEHTGDAVVVEMDAGWSDVGSWSSLWEISEKDNCGNSISGDALILDSRNCLVKSDDKLVATLGIDDLIIVSTKDAIMVAHKDRVQDIKHIIERLKNEDRDEVKFSREVYRPWGFYDSIDNGDGYQVKRITVKPGAKLSVQMHNHRSEHWIVVTGTAKVTLGKKTFLLSENESTYIPLGEVHALENPSTENLELIEVQSGSYLGEDDIVRFDDIYGRT